jgi:hypothetical protein
VSGEGRVRWAVAHRPAAAGRGAGWDQAIKVDWMDMIGLEFM